MSMILPHRCAWLQRRSSSPDVDLVAPAASISTGARPDVQRFIDAHREQGFRYASLDPLRAAGTADAQHLLPERFGLSPSDPLTMDGSALSGIPDVASLNQRLKVIYCGTLALDCSGVRDETRRAWLYARMEHAEGPSEHDGIALLDRLVQVQSWEQHVARRFPDAKRFSLEGCEALVPLLDSLIEEAAAHGIDDVFMGMPHRGRVNVLVNVLRMPAEKVLSYFDPESRHAELHRDLVYHLGGQHTVATSHGEVSVTLAHNPSHLQSVYPVVIGMTHASLARHARDAMAIVLHGDAAFAGQGVVMETLALTQKPGYAVGGVIHVIINNQVGFTEPNLMDAQAFRYCTDVTRMVDAPVLRVNADAPEQMRRAAALALEYRMTFGTDVVIDLIGYRRLGHSEHDLPSVTSPWPCALAERKPSVVDVYGAALGAAGMATSADMAALIELARSAASHAFTQGTLARPALLHEADAATPKLSPLSRSEIGATVSAMTRLPDGFKAHAFIEAMIERWQSMARDEDALADWCFAESMAFASTLKAGIGVRISGLDVRRGTFFHRHAVWHDQARAGVDGREFIPLRQLGPGAARFDVFNSVLSEEAVLGFEYGYSVQDQRSLTIWEAQFGDFVNGAQVFIDQYIAAGEEKWGNRSALVLLLPHGHEGVGPEHSSACLNRFLALCAGDNLCVASPSTSAQFFHLLRRQAFSQVRKPLVVMTPKVTLHKETASHSPVRCLQEEAFQPVLEDMGVVVPSDVTRVVLCSGKLYYDLLRARQAHDFRHVALLRLEQFYPFPHAALAQALRAYPGLNVLVWAQEENKNQGAWTLLRDELALVCPASAALQVVARPATASGATSSHQIHQREQRHVVSLAMGAPRSAS